MSETVRQLHVSALREEFVKQAQTEDSILEIGPFYSPCVRGDNVSYFDVLDTDALVRRAEEIGTDVEMIPRIDFVSATGDLSIVDRKFDAVLSAHCIEHQPDLIGHLRQVRRILPVGGKYYLVIPDKRYCFDHFIPETTIDEIVDAQGLDRHALMKVIEHRAFTTHNNPGMHWAGDHYLPDHYDSILQRTEEAIEEFEAADGNYIDVHSWQFTPKIFSDIVDGLKFRNLIAMSVVSVNETPHNRFEFTAVLEAN